MTVPDSGCQPTKHFGCCPAKCNEKTNKGCNSGEWCLENLACMKGPHAPGVSPGPGPGPGPGPPGPMPEPVRPSPKLPMWVWVGGGVGVALLLIILLFLFF